jgi:UDP-N-acetyl-D-mannosaminuronic acid transferase (WecB/TagA/CpsF family)
MPSVVRARRMQKLLVEAEATGLINHLIGLMALTGVVIGVGSPGQGRTTRSVRDHIRKSYRITSSLIFDVSAQQDARLPNESR